MINPSSRNGSDTRWVQEVLGAEIASGKNAPSILGGLFNVIQSHYGTMRQAVVNFDNEVLAERGFRFDIFRDAGVHDIEILSCEDDRGVIRVHTEEPLATNRLNDMDAIQWWEDVSDNGTEHVYLIEAQATDVRDQSATEDDRHPRCEQMKITDEGLTLTYAGSHDQISEELETLRTPDGKVTLQKIHDYRSREHPLDTLTNRQRDVLATAFEYGYYDVPRKTSVQDIAAHLDLDDSTVSEHLQRAERNLMEQLLPPP